jgi:hypothetical protein
MAENSDGDSDDQSAGDALRQEMEKRLTEGTSDLFNSKILPRYLKFYPKIKVVLVFQYNYISHHLCILVSLFNSRAQLLKLLSFGTPGNG